MFSIAPLFLTNRFRNPKWVFRSLTLSSTLHACPKFH